MSLRKHVVKTSSSFASPHILSKSGCSRQNCRLQSLQVPARCGLTSCVSVLLPGVLSSAFSPVALAEDEADVDVTVLDLVVELAEDAKAVLSSN